MTANIVRKRKVETEIKELRNKLLSFQQMIQSELELIHKALSDNSLESILLEFTFSKQEAIEISEAIDRKCTTLILEGDLSQKTLRFLLTTLKVDIDLNRIHDICLNISKRLPEVYQDDHYVIYPEMIKMIKAAGDGSECHEGLFIQQHPVCRNHESD